MCRQPVLLAVRVSVIACLLAVSAPALAESEGLAADLAILGDRKVDSDGASLLAFFKKRTISQTMRKKVGGLIRLLGDDGFAVREKATTDLIDIGAPARPLLAAALHDSDLEIRRRAQRALEAIGPATAEATLLPAAARVLAHRKPAGSAEVLLDFLPNIEDPDTAEEVARIVGQVALDKTGKPEPAVLLALSDRQWIKRYAAAEALARIAAHRRAVRKLLKDPDSGVRRRVALTLLQAQDKEAVPALIALLESDSREDAGAAEEMLMILAGEKSPTQPDVDSATARERYRKRWESWWKEAGGTIDLAKIDLLAVGKGYTLIGVVDNRNTGKLQEWDSSGKVKWTIDNLRYPVHASKTRRDRVLICESLLNRVTERDIRGKEIWWTQVSGQLLSAQRLPNGNTFIVLRHRLVEVDKSGKEVKVINRTGYDVLGAERHKDGKTTIVTTTGQCVHLDREGRQLRSFSVSPVARLLNVNGLKCHFLPKGGVIVPDYRYAEVREYDSTGKLVWEKKLGTAMRPNSVTRLANGHTLIGISLRHRIIELDKAGREISNKTTDGRLMFLDGR